MPDAALRSKATESPGRFGAPGSSGDWAKRAAAVLIALGPDLARLVFAHLSEDEIRRIAAAAKDLGAASKETVEASVRTYIEELDGLGADLIAGDGLLRDVAISVVGEEVARRAFDGVAPPPPVDEALGSVLDADPEVLAMVLAREQAQTAALVMAAMEPERAAAVMEHIPEPQRPEILRRMAMVEAVSPDVLREIGQALASELRAAVAGGLRRVDGRTVALEMLRRAPAEQQREVLERIERENPDLAVELRSKLFTFDDLLNLTDRDVQALLKEIDSNDLVVALKGATEEVVQKILGNMSSRAAAMVMDDLQAMGPTRLDVVEEAQGRIVEAALKLADDGRITIVRPSDKMV
ncbi:MAG: flagellar motor switch protein FliG [Deltaproteobacteria bacterium]|nr:MAG: flagellar motor switch protein FliG [Deltaproteobacteria bacterium]